MVAQTSFYQFGDKNGIEYKYCMYRTVDRPVRAKGKKTRSSAMQKRKLVGRDIAVHLFMMGGLKISSMDVASINIIWMSSIDMPF